MGEKDYTNSAFLSQKIAHRDSVFIVYTVKDWGRKDWWTFHNYSRSYQMKNDQISYFIGGVFYSKDSLNMITWIGYKLPNVYYKKEISDDKICPSSPDTIFSMKPILGIREKSDTLWDIFPLEVSTVVCGQSKDQVTNIMGERYFEDLAKFQCKYIIQSGPDKGKIGTKEVGYNLQDPDFWEKSTLFQRDTVCSDGLYFAQIIGFRCNSSYCRRDCIITHKPPKIDYPQEILDLYKKR